MLNEEVFSIGCCEWSGCVHCQVARIKDNEAARIRLEEKEQCRREFDQLRREVRENWWGERYGEIDEVRGKGIHVFISKGGGLRMLITEKLLTLSKWCEHQNISLYNSTFLLFFFYGYINIIWFFFSWREHINRSLIHCYIKKEIQ